MMFGKKNVTSVEKKLPQLEKNNSWEKNNS